MRAPGSARSGASGPFRPRAGPVRPSVSIMRTRRIAIRCRRTGRSATVAIGTTGTGLPADLPVPQVPPGLAVPPGYESMPGLDLPPVYGAPAAGHAGPGHPSDDAGPPSDDSAPATFSVPAYLADPGPGPSAHHSGRVSVNPWRSNRGPDLTLADVLARPGRRDLDWDRNPGWPDGVGWAQIARGTSPRHARGGGWRLPGPALVWTGVGLLAAAVLMLVAALVR